MNYNIKNFLLSFFVVLASGILFLSTSVLAEDERIKNYHSDITIQSDGSLNVTETITVWAAGDKIKRGIYRDFPTSYDLGGSDYNIGFELLSVLRDGALENYFIGDLSNGVRIYMGEENYFLSPGEYTYTIRYRTTRQLSYREDFDELYWNVTGNGWDFDIERTSVTVNLPSGAKVLNQAGYTGHFGDSGTDYDSVVSDSLVNFHTTRKLGVSEGFTIAVSWPKGFVVEPDPIEQAEIFFNNNFGITIGTIFLVIMTGYFSVMWWKYGRDPASGIVIPRFSAPKTLSPAAVGYVLNNGYKRGYSEKIAFSAALVNLAIKGYLKILNEKKEYRLKRLKTGDFKDLSKGERVIFDGLFTETEDEYLLDREYDSEFEAVYNEFSSAVANQYNYGYFSNNHGKWFIGALIGLLGIILSLTFEVGGLAIPALFMMFFFGVISVIFISHISKAVMRQKVKCRIVESFFLFRFI